MIAYIFPGQGSQYAGMGRELAEQYPAARAVFEQADDALGFSLSRLCFEGAAEELQLTENTQPAILTVSIAALRALQTEADAPAPDFVAGHSLGEYSALVAAGALSFASAVRTVRARGRYMQEAVAVGVGAMAAIRGSDLQTIQTACEEAREGEVCSPANINAPNQVVIAGHRGAVERALALLKERGVRVAKILPVSAPFHCALMLPAQERLAEDLAKLPFEDLQLPLVTNVDAAVIKSGAEARDALVRQVSSAVLWQRSLELLSQQGVERFVELGPGKVLCGIVRQTLSEARCQHVEDAATLRNALRSDAPQVTS